MTSLLAEVTPWTDVSNGNVFMEGRALGQVGHQWIRGCCTGHAVEPGTAFVRGSCQVDSTAEMTSVTRYAVLLSFKSLLVTVRSIRARFPVPAGSVGTVVALRARVLS